MNTETSNIDALVKEYLIRKGFTKAAAEMENEFSNNQKMEIDSNNESSSSISIPKDKLNSLSQQFISNISEDIIILGFNDGDVKLYNEGYDSFRSWTCNSLDMVKTELLSVCFPLFVYCYIGLIKRKHENDAKIFWKTWEKDHIETHGDELRSLSMLTSHIFLDSEDFLDSNPFVRQSILSKFTIYISSFAYGLLASYLMQNDLLLIAAIINDKIIFKNSENLINNSYVDQSIELQGYLPTPTIKLQVENEANLKNLPSISLGVPGKGIISNDIKMPDTRDDKLYSEWLKYLVRPKLLLSSNYNQNETLENKIIGNSLEPSIIFATLTNTSDGMICMNINKSATQAVAGFRDSSVRVWNLNEKEENENLGVDFSMSEVLPKTKSNFQSSNNLISSSSQKVSSMQSAESKSSSYPMLELRGHRKAVYGVSQDSTNRLVLSSSADETIRLWDTSVGQSVGKYNCVGPAWDVDFGPLGYYFASANQDRTVSIYSTDRNAPIRLMTGHVSDATCVRWHDNASLLASGSDDKTARLWDMRSGECARLFKGSNAPLSCIACSHDGRLVAAGTDNGMLYLWDINTGRQMAIFQGHIAGQAVHSLAFSADSIGLTSGSADCSVRVWDIASVCSQPPMISSLVGSGLSQVSCHKVFYTKFTSTYFVDYSDKNLLIAGGPFSLSSIQTAQLNSNQQQSIKINNNSGEALSVLSISHAVYSNI